MYESDNNKPWDWADYVLVIGVVILGVLLILGFAYAFYTFQPEPIPVYQCGYSYLIGGEYENINCV